MSAVGIIGLQAGEDVNSLYSTRRSPRRPAEFLTPPT